MANETTPLPSVVTPFYLDKGLWVAVLGTLFAFLNAKLDINLRADEIVGMMLPIVSYIVMHKWAATSKAKAYIGAEAGKAASNSPQSGLSS